MRSTITITDLAADGTTLSDEELANVAGGMRCADPCAGSSKTMWVDSGDTDKDTDF